VGFRLTALLVLVAACALSFEELHDVRPLNEFIDLSSGDSPQAAEAEAANAAQTAAQAANDAQREESILADKEAKALQKKQEAEANMATAKGQLADLEREKTENKAKLVEDQKREQTTGQAAQKSADEAAAAEKELAEARAQASKIDGVAGKAKVLSETELAELKKEQSELEPLRVAMNKATNAFKDKEHKIRILRGEVSKDTTRSDHERQQESSAKRRQEEAQRSVDAAESKASAAKARHDQAAKEQALAKQDFDKAKQAEEATKKAAQDYEKMLAEAEKNGTATAVGNALG
jgi:chromosome segregation ATPase